MEKEASVGKDYSAEPSRAKKLGEIRTLSREDYGSGGLVPQRLLYVKGLHKTNFLATLMP